VKDLVENLVRLSQLKFKEFQLDGNKPPWGPVATVEEIETTEEAIGIKLPSSLRNLYLQVSNGGFGPGYGLMSVSDRDYDESAHDVYIEAFYKFAKREDDYEIGAIWPSNIIGIIDFGCGMTWCLDCETDKLVYFAGDSVDLEDVDSFYDAFVYTDKNLEDGLRDWCGGLSWETYLS